MTPLEEMVRHACTQRGLELQLVRRDSFHQVSVLFTTKPWKYWSVTATLKPDEVVPMSYGYPTYRNAAEAHAATENDGYVPDTAPSPMRLAAVLFGGRPNDDALFVEIVKALDAWKTAHPQSS